MTATSLRDLVADYFDTRKQIDDLEQQKEGLSKHIVEAMRLDGLTESRDYFGRALRLQERLECDYSDKAYQYAEKNGLIELFTPKPKITRAKVLEAKKKNKLTLAQFTKLEKEAVNLELKRILVSFQIKDDA